MVTRVVAINNLRKYTGESLAHYAHKYDVTIYTAEGKYNKGWKGLVLERLAGLDNSNEKAPNGLGFELKSVSYYTTKAGSIKPKETMAITMINRKELLTDSFFDSHCWDKLKSLVFCATSWEGKGESDSTLLAVSSFDFLMADKVVQEIAEDYEYIRKKCKEQGWDSLTGRDGKWIQARTKGAKNSNTRAFYARKDLIVKILAEVK